MRPRRKSEVGEASGRPDSGLWLLRTNPLASAPSVWAAASVAAGGLSWRAGAPRSCLAAGLALRVWSAPREGRGAGRRPIRASARRAGSARQTAGAGSVEPERDGEGTPCPSEPGAGASQGAWSAWVGTGAGTRSQSDASEARGADRGRGPT